ncbi:MAG: PHP domain-containing protein [Methanotrichaceae archaeon]|nr:PHP domain-containing protein [Methanotrichaceae archaeon]
MRFDLHIHSNFSDGHADVRTILKMASKKGLNGLSITDHDTMRGLEPARRINKDLDLGLILIPGVETTTLEGHLIILGVVEAPTRKMTIEETIEVARDLGGIVVVPHPYHPFRNAIGRIPDCDAVEVFNSKHIFGIANARAKLVARRRGLPMVAGSDSHYAQTIGLGVTLIEAEDVDSAIQAIHNGQTRIDGHRTPPKLFVGNVFKHIYSRARKKAILGRRR